jgi:uncharacterized protein YecT (DUF1311 family)
MKRILAGLFLLSLSGAAHADGPCEAKTQAEANACEADKYKAADAEMNRVYKAALKRLEGDKKATDKLKAAQRAWMAFRDAELAAHFPAGASIQEYGSVFPMCQSSHLTDLTQARTQQLSFWAVGVEEGDVCAGSYPPKK